LEVYYDAKGLTPGAVGSSISGLGGTTISATKLGDPQVSNDAFVFDGSGDAIVSGATSLSGKTPLSYSVWFKTNSISSTGSNSIVQIGYAAGTESLGFRIRGSGVTAKPGNYRFYVYGGATNESVDTDIKAEIGTWTHATVVYDGLNSKLYIDGKFVVENTNTATNLNLDSGAKVALGNYIDSNGALFDAVRSYDGSIANVRLFNRVITSDEVWQLYAYQKEYFGHGDLSMTLKAGRLGIGTSEPRAMLDVRGDMDVIGDVNIPSGRFTTHRFMGSGSGTFEGSGNITLPFDLDYGPDDNPNIGWEIRLAFGASGTNYGNCSISGCYDNEDTLTGVSEAFSLQLRTTGTNWSNQGSECFLSRRETVAPAYQAIIRIVNPLAENIPAPSSGSSYRWHFSYECTGCYASTGATTIRGGGYFLFGAADRRIKRLILNSATGSISGHYNFVAIS
jgi:hypothetical protein